MTRISPHSAIRGALGLALIGATLGVSACGDESTAPARRVPSQVSVATGDAQTGAAGTPLAEPVVVRVADAQGRPVAGVNVDWAVGADAGAGSVSPARSQTDRDGLAETTWAMGTRVGEADLTATVAGIVPARLRATVTAGAPARVETVEGDAQQAYAGSPLPTPLAVRVSDAHGNPVAGVTVLWSVVAGDGTLSAPQSQTDASGVARTEWTLGAAQGTQVARATVGDLAPTTFAATAVAVPTHTGLNLSVAGVHVTQTVQTLGGSVPLVRGKPGLLRVFVRASEANKAIPSVRVRIFHDGSLVETRTIAAPGASTPLAVDESVLSGSWNLALPGSLIVPGLGVQVEVDPDRSVPEGSEGDNVFPSGGSPLALDVRSPAAFNVRFVPVQTANGTIGNVSDANKEGFLTVARKLLPLNAIDADVRATYVTSAPELQSGDGNHAWTKILSELSTLRVADGSTRYYYGVVKAGYTSGVAGYGYVGGRAAVGWDYLPSGAAVAAHEWGHNFGRNHAPCGGVSSSDPRYPYSGGIIGTYGYDASTGQLKPSSFTDLMGYCGSQWISDYTYRGVLDFRAAEAGQAATVTDATVRPALLVWGRVHDRGVELEPAFDVATRPVLPRRTGDYTVAGYDASGTRLWSFSFDPEGVADAKRGERHFSLAIPADVAQPGRLASIRLEGRGRSDERRRRPAAATAPSPSARWYARGRARIRWDADAYPMALVRDAATGEVLALARGGDIEVRARGRAVEVVLSEGVRSVRRKVEIQQ